MKKPPSSTPSSQKKKPHGRLWEREREREERQKSNIYHNLLMQRGRKRFLGPPSHQFCNKLNAYVRTMIIGSQLRHMYIKRFLTFKIKKRLSLMYVYVWGCLSLGWTAFNFCAHLPQMLTYHTCNFTHLPHLRLVSPPLILQSVRLLRAQLAKPIDILISDASPQPNF